MSQRTDRVADSLRKELSVLLMREVRDPRVALATISRVQVARDLGHARIWISVLGDEETRQQTMAGDHRQERPAARCHRVGRQTRQAAISPTLIPNIPGPTR